MRKQPAVSARAVLKAILSVKRRGSELAMRMIERRDPEVADYMLEEFTRIHRKLLELGAEPRLTIRLQKQIEMMAMVVVEAMAATTPRRQATAGESGRRDARP